jgi:hypothetical protein
MRSTIAGMGDMREENMISALTESRSRWHKPASVNGERAHFDVTCRLCKINFSASALIGTGVRTIVINVQTEVRQRV